MHAGELNILARTRVLLVRARQHERACWQSVRVLTVCMAVRSQCRWAASWTRDLACTAPAGLNDTDEAAGPAGRQHLDLAAANAAQARRTDPALAREQVDEEVLQRDQPAEGEQRQRRAVALVGAEHAHHGSRPQRQVRGQPPRQPGRQRAQVRWTVSETVALRGLPHQPVAPGCSVWRM